MVMVDRGVGTPGRRVFTQLSGSKEYIRLFRDGSELHSSVAYSRIHSVLRTVPALPDRLSLKADPPASVNLIYDSEILVCNQNFPCYLTLIDRI